MSLFGLVKYYLKSRHLRKTMIVFEDTGMQVGDGWHDVDLYREWLIPDETGTKEVHRKKIGHGYVHESEIMDSQAGVELLNKGRS